MAGYQFIHVDSYGREGSIRTTKKTKKSGENVTTTTRVRSASDILAEQWREQGACPHIKNPQAPNLIFGMPPMDVLPMIHEWADQAKDAQGRKLRKDGLCVLVGVASLPREMESNFDDFARDTVKWLQEKYGDRLKSVVVHNDEAHPHLHFTVVPRIGERFDDMHEGYKASRLAKEEGKKKGEQNLAYIEAMRRFQDEFSEKVAMSHGLTRIGPARRRLSRPAWKAEQQQAAYFANLKRIAQIYARKGYEKGMEKARKEAASILDEARKRAESMGSRVSSFFAGLMHPWHEPPASAKA
jgi:hypothetical protein